MILLSVGLSYVLDRRSNKAVEALGKRVQSSSVVALRDGKEVEIPISEIVPGDVVLLQAGSIIPADLRLITAKDFFMSQSVLTGESMPIEKKSEPQQISGNYVFELLNACFQGSNVISGSARGVVVNTGTRTYFGSISERLTETRQPTSFDKGVKSFTYSDDSIYGTNGFCSFYDCWNHQRKLARSFVVRTFHCSRSYP